VIYQITPKLGDIETTTARVFELLGQLEVRNREHELVKMLAVFLDGSADVGNKAKVEDAWEALKNRYPTPPTCTTDDEKQGYIFSALLLELQRANTEEECKQGSV
jgi:hypothetical protein